MAADQGNLVEVLRAGPAILLLGQRILAEYGTQDHFLAAVSEKLERPYEAGYARLPEDWAKWPAEALPGFLQGISSRVAVPEGLGVVATAPWNAVLTTSVTEVVDRAFRVGGRTVIAKWNPTTAADDPRSRNRLHVTYLFGCVNGESAGERPPGSRLELRKRQSIAQHGLEAMASLVTPRGALVIDGYDPSDDWLGLDQLILYVSRLGSGQIHWFNAAPNVAVADELAQDLVTRGVLTLHPEPLADWIKTAGLVLCEFDPDETPGGISLTTRRGRHKFTLADWRRQTSGLTVPDDVATAAPLPANSDDDLYQMFRQFLADSGYRSTPRWEDYLRCFVFRRDAYEKLYDQVAEQLADSALKPEPLILSGQSGSGKTVSLTQLAVDARRVGWPVVCLGRNIQWGVFERVGVVCEFLEGLDQECVLVVWDGNQDSGEYAALAQHLAGRGRKALVVGSCYRQSARFGGIHFDTRLVAPLERDRFFVHLAQFGIAVSADQVREVDDTFFTLLFRFLPTLRPALRKGLPPEFKLGLEMARQAPEKRSERSASRGWLIDRLKEQYPDRWATLFSGPPAADHAADPDERDRRLVEELTQLIMVPGRYDVALPVDTLNRCLGDQGLDLIRQIEPQKLGVFDWSEDESGNPLLVVRSSLEARLLCEYVPITPEDEIRILRRLVTAANIPPWPAQNHESQFVAQLFRQLEPDGEYGHLFKNRLGDLVAILTDLRNTAPRRIYPQLALREGNLRREWLKEINGQLLSGMAPTADPFAVFLDGTELLTEAVALIERAGDQRRHRRLSSHILTELASLYGTAQRYYAGLIQQGTSPAEITRWRTAMRDHYQEAIDHCKEAQRMDPLNDHTPDVRIWVTQDRLRAEAADLTEEERGRLLAEIYDALEEDSWANQPERQQERFTELAKLIGDRAMFDRAISALKARNSPLATYLTACDLAYTPDHLFRSRQDLANTITFLDAQPDSMNDLKTLRLYQRVWWELHGNPDLLQRDKERVRVRMSEAEWRRFADLLLRRRQLEGEGSLRTQFLSAVALFHAGEFRQARDEFDLLQQLPGGSNRAVRLALWCDAAGVPILCRGKINRVYNEDRRGVVFVPQIRQVIPFQTMDFYGQRIEVGEFLDEFHIAFNFRGPIADRIQRRERKP
jgi:hypothetical protein